MSLRGEKNSRHTHKTESWCLLGENKIHATPTKQDLGVSQWEKKTPHPQNRILVSLRGEQNSRHTYKTGSWCLSGEKKIHATPTKQDLGVSQGGKKFTPHPQNRILVSLRGEKNSRHTHTTGSWCFLGENKIHATPTKQDLGVS